MLCFTVNTKNVQVFTLKQFPMNQNLDEGLFFIDEFDFEEYAKKGWK